MTENILDISLIFGLWLIYIFVLFLAPFPPSNINSNYEMIDNELYKINVTWDLPEYIPDNYTVLLNLNSKGDLISKNVSGVSIEKA